MIANMLRTAGKTSCNLPTRTNSKLRRAIMREILGRDPVDQEIGANRVRYALLEYAGLAPALCAAADDSNFSEWLRGSK